MRPEVVFLCLFCLVGCGEPTFQEPNEPVRKPAEIPYRIIAGEKPNQYQVELLPPDHSYALSGYTILKNSKDSVKAAQLNKALSTTGSLIDDDVVGGETYSYELYLDGDAHPTFASTIQVPSDFIFDKPTHFFEELKSKKIGRMYFENNGVLYTDGQDVALDVDEIHVGNDANISIRAFDYWKPAEKFKDGKNSQPISIKVKRIEGQLYIANAGETGGEGRKGLTGNEGDQGTPGIWVPQIPRNDPKGLYKWTVSCVYKGDPDWKPYSDEQQQLSPYDKWLRENPARGGRGGVGKQGYPGYPGMRGGNGGPVFIEVPKDQVSKVTVIRSGGAPGRGGEGGDGGPGGRGGPPGTIHCYHDDLPRCCSNPPWGLTGDTGKPGTRGQVGAWGEDSLVTINGEIQPAIKREAFPFDRDRFELSLGPIKKPETGGSK